MQTPANSIGLAGFGGPYPIGWVKEAIGSTGLLVLAVLIAGLLVFLGGYEAKAEFTAVAPAR